MRQLECTNLALTSILSLLLLGACSDVQPEKRTQQVDLGTHVAGDEPQIVPVEVEIRNRTFQAREVAGISTTCGCLDARMSSSTVEPRSVAMLHANMKLVGSGTQRQKITVQYTDGSQDVVLVHATVRREKEMVCSPDRVISRLKGSVPIRFVRTANVELDEKAQIKIVGPVGVRFEFGGSTTIEEIDYDLGRPCRQVGSGVLFAEEYGGVLPLVIEFYDDIGSRCEFRIIK